MSTAVGRSPLIGIVSNFDAERRIYTCRPAYSEAIEATGGVPVILPYIQSDIVIDGLLASCDGILLSGGGDFHPSYYGEEMNADVGLIIPARDRFEDAILKKILKDEIPTLGICRGMQWLGAAAGGSLISHIPTANPEADDHYQQERLEHAVHDVLIEPDSLLSRIVGTTKLGVNTWHHQAVRTVPPGFRCTARSPDGVIEAIESQTAPFILGVQWHPESLYIGSIEQTNIFSAFVSACRKK